MIEITYLDFSYSYHGNIQNSIKMKPIQATLSILPKHIIRSCAFDMLLLIMFGLQTGYNPHVREHKRS